MSDIVERLREGVYRYNHETRTTERHITKNERLAAEEITRLRAELAEAKIEIERQRARVNKWVNAAMRNEEYDDDGR
jgi:hypothetical protein